MKLPLIAFIIICRTANSYADEASTSTGMSFELNGVEYSITEERFNACPKWDPANGEEPPCSVSSALKAANKNFSRPLYDWTKDDPHNKLWLESMNLVRLGGEFWAWKATYEFRPRNRDKMGMAVQHICWILMDGRILEPAVIKQKNNAEQAGAGQPATRPASKSEGSDKPQPEEEGRSR